MTVLFGWILSRSKFWKAHTNLRIITVSTNSRKNEAEEMISKLLEYCRIEARVLVLTLDDEDIPGEPLRQDELNRAFLMNVSQERRCSIFNYLMSKHSQNAAIIFFPIAEPPSDIENSETYLNSLDVLSKGLHCPTVLVRGCGNVITSDI